MTTFIVIAVIVLVVVAVAAYVIRKKDREANIAKADELRAQAATRAQSSLPPAQDKAAEAEARAEEARAAAERAKAEADEARVTASQAEAEHESQVRDADRLDPRVDHTSDDYAPQVGGTVDQQPTAPSEANREPETAPQSDTAPETRTDTPADSADSADTAYVESTESTESAPTEDGPVLPRRTPGANDMPGKPMETDGTSGGWFTRKDSDNA